jgi:hypothetical protein
MEEVTIATWSNTEAGNLMARFVTRLEPCKLPGVDPKLALGLPKFNNRNKYVLYIGKNVRRTLLCSALAGFACEDDEITSQGFLAKLPRHPVTAGAGGRRRTLELRKLWYVAVANSWQAARRVEL